MEHKPGGKGGHGHLARGQQRPGQLVRTGLRGYCPDRRTLPSGAHRQFQWPQKAQRPVYSVLDTSKLSEFLGKKPRPWPQALRDFLFSEYVPGAHADKEGTH